MENKDEEEKRIPIKTDGDIVYSYPSDIEFLESVKNKHQIIVHYVDHDKHPPLTANGCIKDYLKLLPSTFFCLIHRSFAANIRKIAGYDRCHWLTMDSKIEVPLSESGKQNLQEMGFLL